jgi:hypothetical protein
MRSRALKLVGLIILPIAKYHTAVVAETQVSRDTNSDIFDGFSQLLVLMFELLVWLATNRSHIARSKRSPVGLSLKIISLVCY